MYYQTFESFWVNSSKLRCLFSILYQLDMKIVFFLYSSLLYLGFTNLIYDGLYVGSKRHQWANHSQRPKQEEKDGGPKAPQPFQVDHQHCQYLRTQFISVSVLVEVNREIQNTLEEEDWIPLDSFFIYIYIYKFCIDSVQVSIDYCECLLLRQGL